MGERVISAPTNASDSLALPQVRFSHLRAYGRSPMHGKLARERDMAPSAAMQIGSAVHALVLDTQKVVGYPGAVRRGKEYDTFVSQNPNSLILTMADYDKARAMADAVLDSEVARPYLQGAVEERLEFSFNYLRCRATPDIRGTKFITELKTASSSDPQRFHWHALRMHYHAQMAMQLTACDDCGHDQVDDCYVVCVESAEPYPVTVFKFTVRALDAGYKLLMLWGERLKNCELSKQYPPYSQAVVELDVPDEEAELVFGDNSGTLEEIAA